MNRDERYIAHHKAVYLHRVVTHRRFPAEFLADRNFTAAVADLIGDPVFDAITNASDTHDLSPRLRRRRSRRRVQESSDGPPIGQLVGRVADDLARTVRSTEGRLAAAPLHRKFERLAQILELDRFEAELVHPHSAAGPTPNAPSMAYWARWRAHPSPHGKARRIGGPAPPIDFVARLGV